MSTTTVFNWENLKKEADKLRELKVEEKGFIAKALALVGRASVSEDTVKLHNDLINKTIKSYTDNMNALLSLTEQMKKEGLNNNIIMERMSNHIEKLENTLKAQKQDIINSNNIILNHKNTIDGLKTQNKIFEQANQTLISQNEEQQKTNNTLTAQNEEQKTTNQNLTRQNEEQRNTIADMENNLTKLNAVLKTQTNTLEEQTTKIQEINKSNADLNTQLEKLKATQTDTGRKLIKSRLDIVNLKKEQEKNIKDIKAAQKIRVLFLKNSAKNKLKLQGKAFLNRIAEIKENSNNSIADKEAKIKEITEQHTKAQNKINTQLTNLTATSNATIGDLKKELSSFKTEEKLSKEDQEKQKKMLNTVTRVFPLSWKNSKGFNIGNITTQVRGNKPYHANDTIDYYLHTLFKGESPIGEPRDIISSKQVPIRGILKETSGGKKNRMKKSKKSNKSKNNKTKKQRGKR